MRRDLMEWSGFRREANLVPAVVDAQTKAAPLHQVATHAVDERERQVPVRDRRAERALRRSALDVDVDPLVIAAQFGELVDHLLGDLAPPARSDDLILERVDALDPVTARLGP